MSDAFELREHIRYQVSLLNLVTADPADCRDTEEPGSEQLAALAQYLPGAETLN